METLFQKQAQLLKNTSLEIVRDDINRIHWDARLVSIRGSRGVGKTTLMLQYIKQHYAPDQQQALYCSLDSIYFSTHNLLDLAMAFYQQGGKHLFLDEVHKYPTWSKEIKEIYDTYPELKLVISGSSMLNIINADADLSRRCIPYQMHGLSFREFLLFYKKVRLPAHTLQEILGHPAEICGQVNQACRPIGLFAEYLKGGYYPFFDGNLTTYYIQIENVVNFILEQELPALSKIDPSYVLKLKALVEILAHSIPYEVDIQKLATTLNLSRNTVLHYLGCMQRAEVLQLLYADSMSVTKLQKPQKIYLQNPNMLYALSSTEVNIGTARETFAVNQLSRNHRVEYGKTKGDFLIDGAYTFEIGGPDKGFSQIAGVKESYVFADGIEFASGRKLPLWLLGMM